MATQEYIFEGKTIKEHLLEMAADGNKQFARTLHPGIDHVLGLRIPQLRMLGRRIAKSGDWREYLVDADTFYMEERMLQGFVLGAVKVPDVDEYLALIDRFVPLINSWSVCDTFDFAGKHRFVEKHKERIWNYLERWIVSEREYEVRFAVVMMLAHFVDADYVGRVVDWMCRTRHPGYYVKMAVAWNLSVCFVKFPDEVRPELQARTLAPDVHNMTIRKIIESLRVSNEIKAECRSYIVRR